MQADLAIVGGTVVTATSALLGKDIPIVEQATRLGEVGPDPFLLRAPFFLLGGVEAAPRRIFGEPGD